MNASSKGEIMFGGVAQSTIIVATSLVLFALDRLYTQRFDRLRTAGGTATTWWHALVSVALALVLVAQPLVWPRLGLHTDEVWGLALQVLGLIGIAASFALLAWSRSHLGAFYAQRAEVQPGHRVIQDGPYAYVRHPIFSAYMLQAIGLLLVVPSLPMLLVTIYSLTLFTWTGKRDEGLLRDELPGYAEYMAHTPGFFPRLRRVEPDGARS
jgi:protein-S-isoprenylcysteine O-methyltransferase Ste14